MVRVKRFDNLIKEIKINITKIENGFIVNIENYTFFAKTIFEIEEYIFIKIRDFIKDYHKKEVEYEK